MFIVTGGAGFIGSAFIQKLNAEGIDDILIVDSLGTGEKWRNLVGKRYTSLVDIDQFLEYVLDDSVPVDVEALIHLGACTSTTETNADYLYANNYEYTKYLSEWALEHNTRFIYASSAAVYGDGALGFSDDEQLIPDLRPLNMYGYSKLLFDQWAHTNKLFDSIVGLRFFNVYGPNEYHKDNMSSVVYKATQQVQNSGKVKLFKSENSNYADGEQMRDFIYVKDCVDLIWWLFENPRVNGIFNLGTGKAETWLTLANSVFKSLGKQSNIEFVPLPKEIANNYQYFTEAPMEKLRSTGYQKSFTALSDGVSDYVANYLSEKLKYY